MEVAPESYRGSDSDILRADVGGENRDFDQPLTVPPVAPDYKSGQVIRDKDVAEVIQHSFAGNGLMHIELKDGYEALVEKVEEGRFKIMELMSIERGQD